MNSHSLRKSIAWFLIFSFGHAQLVQAASLALAPTPLAATTTTVVRPNLVYVLDDSGSMAWDYTPDYINDNPITDPTNPLYGPNGSSGDIGNKTIVGGVITAISAVGGNVYQHATPTVLIQGDGINAAAHVTMNANRTIASVVIDNGGTGYTAAGTYVTFLGGLKTSGWGMCWGTTTTGGPPKDSSANPACTARPQMPYSTSRINYQYYDPAVRYLPPIKADGSSYAAASITLAPVSSTGSGAYKDTLTPAPNQVTTFTNLNTDYEHEIWCSTLSPSPAVTAANIATHLQCKENTDTSNNNLYPNATYTYKNKYFGPASYFTMDASEFCSGTDLTNCITRAQALAAVPAFKVGGVDYVTSSYYRWCSYYNPVSKTFGGCQGRRDLDHYIPNYLGGWIGASGAAAGVQASADLIIGPNPPGTNAAPLVGNKLNSVTVGGVDIVGGQTFTSTGGDQNTIATNVCTAIQANTGTTGYACSVSNNRVTIQAAAVGTASNGLPVLALGPINLGAANAEGKISVSPGGATTGLSITSIKIQRADTSEVELLAAPVTADGNERSTAQRICNGIVGNAANASLYTARSGTDGALPAWGTCDAPDVAYVMIQRMIKDTTDNNATISVTGPAAATISTGAIQINSTAGATSISDVTLAGVSIMTAPALSIADGTQQAAIADSLAAKINGNGGCSASAPGLSDTVTITGCTGALAVVSNSAQATATMKVTSTTHAYGANLGTIQVSATTIAPAINSGTITNGTSVSNNATSIRTAINNGTGTHGFTAAAPTANGDGTYNIVVTAPVGTANNGLSFTFNDGPSDPGGVSSSPIWSFGINGASSDSKLIDYVRCSAAYAVSSDASTGTTSGCGTNNLTCTTALANGLNGAGINGYSYSCSYDTGSQNNQDCYVTGPSGASACTGDLVRTYESGITIDSYNKTSSGSPGCAAISAPTWTFYIDDADEKNKKIASIKCGGVNTIAVDTVSSGSNNNETPRRKALATGLEANGANGYTYDCDTTVDKPTCTVTGPVAAANCTNLSFDYDGAIDINDKSSVTQTCPAAPTTAASATWYFRINDATTLSKKINSITCGGVNTITTETVNTGAAAADPVSSRINNLTTSLMANDINSYTVSCTTATSTTPSSTCTVTGPVGVNACTAADFDCPAGSMRIAHDSTISMTGGAAAGDVGSVPTKRYCVAATSNGSSGTTAVDNFAPYLFTVSPFSGGAPSQNTTITPITSTTVGPISTLTTNMNGGVASSNAVPTNATGTSPNVLALDGGSAPVVGSNRWTGVGIFKRVDIVNDGRTFNRASTRTDCVGGSCSYTEEMQNFANWYSYYRTRMLLMKSATTLAFNQLDGNYRVGFDNICQATGTTVDNPVNQFTGANRTAWWTSLTKAAPACATPLRAETAKIGRYFAGKQTVSTAHPDPIEYSCQQNYMLLVTDGYWNEVESTAIKKVDGSDINNTDNNILTAARPYYDGEQASTTCTTPASGTTRSGALSCRTLADITYHYYSTDLRTSALGNANGALGTDVSANNVLTTADDKNLAQHMNFFAMGLGIEGKLAYRSDYQTATIGDYYSILKGIGGVNWPAVANLDPTGVDDLWHATVNGRGKYFSARNVPNVVAGLREALNKIGARVGSAAAAATSNLEPVPGDNFAYVASYQTQDWVGDLQSRSINVATGDVSPETNCAAIGVQKTISGASGATTITVSDTTDLVVGAAVTGTGIATGAVVTAISGLGVTLSQVNTGVVSGSGTFKYGCQWSAQAKLEATTWSARRIYVKPSSGTSGDPLRAFTYDNLSGAERAYFNPGPDACVGAANPSPTTNLSQYCPLGGIASVPEMTTSNLVDFLRGNREYEQDGELGHAQVWRNRARVLGDIVNTQPIFIKAPSAAYTDTGYSAFKTAQASRKPLVVVSSQDGMLHAFNAYAGNVSVNGSPVGPGEEMWAFAPTEAMANMKWLADANYSHRFLVDGLIAVGDVDFGSNDWRTILVGGLGSGGSSYYALDITDPTNPKYLWEFSHANLGKTYSNVAITKLHTGEWTVMFSSGYNNTANGGDGGGHLFAINPRTAALMSGFPISNLSGTGGSPSNLGKITPWADSPATNNTTQFVYAGDTNGDLWRFDMDPTGTGHTGSAVFKLAHLENAGVPQPITTKPELTRLQDDVRLIMVGTGKYLEVSDLLNTDIQAVYAIKDTMGAANKGGASQATWNPTTDMLPSDATKPMFLERKLISVDQNDDPITHTDSYGVISVHRKICAGSTPTVTSSGSAPNLTYTCTGADTTALDYSVHGGWFARFPAPVSPDSGERVNVDPRIVSGTLLFASNIPSASACTVGGNAWFTAVDAATGLAIEEFASTKVSGALVVGLTVIRLISGEYKAIATRSDYKQETLSVPVAAAAAVSNTFQSKRGLWREFEAY